MSSDPTTVPTVQAVQAARARPGARPPMRAGERRLAVIGYFATVYRRIWRGTIIGRFLSPLLFLLSMGIGLGSLVDRSTGGVDGHSYLQFVVPAIVATQAMWLAMGESTYQVLAYIKWNRMYEAMLATPLSVTDVLLGHLLTVVGHLVTATTIFVVVAALFGGFGSWWAVLTIPVAVLTGMAFTVPIFAYSAQQSGDDGFNILYRLLITPLMLFSGTFFPIDQLPAVLRPIAWVTPLWHGVELCRAAAYASFDLLPDLGHLLVLLVYIGVGWVLAKRSFTRRLVS